MILLVLWNAKNVNKSWDKELVLIIMYSTFILASGILLVGTFIVGYERAWRYSVAFGCLITVWFSTKLVQEVNIDIQVKNIIYIITILSLVVSILSIYPAPLTKEVNYSISETEIEGHDWIINTKSESKVYSIIRDMDRFEQLVTGNPKADTSDTKTGPPPESLDFSGKNSSYLFLGPGAESYYPTVFPGYQSKWAYKSGDFSRINNSDDFVKIYSNGEVTIHYS
ncbi:hypothetical protein [Haloarchaeobius sp. DYHT-AS-18]|uniref:hypothetical protein n=1 Tax=Haloarchaeobius sp. DYHT-AS-18 TaxID=3446117 RepID=UPI003EBA2B62